ncbi:MAG: hypothetical protein ACLUIO_07070 [Neglectibacter timonensis]
MSSWPKPPSVKSCKEIARLEKQARAERQPKKKFELVQKIKAKQQEMEVTL